jgi:uncharacterized protein (TIGR03000 family)
MLRKLTVLTLAAALVVAGAAPAYARGARGGGGGGGARGFSGGGRGYGGGGYGYRNDGFRGFGTGFAIGAGVGALAGYPYYGYGGYGGYYGSPGYYSEPSYYSTAPVYVDPGYTSGVVVPSMASPTSMNPSYTSAYPATPAVHNTALINIHVPANAKVFFGDAATSNSQTGTERQFESPALEPGSNYQYQLRAQWNENGQTVNRTRTVAVHANDVVNVDFTQATN